MCANQSRERFRFDGFVTTDFAVRRPETDALAELLEQGQRVYLDGPRRCGKTSLVLNCAAEAARKVLHIDLTGVETGGKLLERVDGSTRRFLRESPAVKRVLQGRSEATKATISAGLPGVFKADIAGERQTSLAPPAVTLDTLLDAVAEVAREAKAVVFIDEFQSVKSRTIEHPAEVLGSFAAVSSPSRTRDEVSWVFAGSNRHAMHQIFTASTGTFYQHVRNLPIGPIPAELILPFLGARLGAKMSDALSLDAYRWAEGIPGDLQRLYCSVQARMVRHEKEVTAEVLDLAKADVLRDLGRSYSIALQKINGQSAVAARLLDLVAQNNLRSVDQLRVKCRAVRFPGADANRALLEIMEEGLLHVESSGLLQRPEPLLFHYLVDRPAVTHAPLSGLLPDLPAEAVAEDPPVTPRRRTRY
jgi:hypothetical protein